MIPFSLLRLHICVCDSVASSVFKVDDDAGLIAFSESMAETDLRFIVRMIKFIGKTKLRKKSHIFADVKPITMIRRLSLLTTVAAVLLSCSGNMEPIDYVNPYIGNISHLLVPTFPTVQLPNSMLRVYPERSDYTSEYLSGLPVMVTNHRERSAFKLSVSTEEITSSVVPVSYDNEHITPYSFDVVLADGNIHAGYAVSHQSAIYELKSESPLNMALSSLGGEVAWDGSAISGHQTVSGKTCVYVYMEPSVKPSDAQVKSFGNHSSAVLSFDSTSVRLRYGVSFISVEQAKANLRREIPDFDIASLAEKGRKVWNDVLARIEVKGGSEDQKTVFYTSYYRTFERPVCLSEDGRYWSAFDGRVHEDEGVPFYTDDWIWDTYRAAHPLRVIMDREIEEDILASFLRMAEQTGDMWLPTFPETIGDTRRMNSNHTVATFADAIVKGLDVDVRKAFIASKNVLTEKTLAPWCGNPAGWLDEFYWTNGYIPALRKGEAETDPNVHGFEKRQPVAVTLGTSYDSWCLAVIAEAAGHKEDAEYFHERSFNYRNIFNDRTLFFHPKDKDGNFIENLDYSFSGGMGAREYYGENNGWVYRWDVQHNIPDLIELMGGREGFCRELDRMFATSLGRSKYQFYSMLPDHTGNVGQFSMANEPSLHVPYLYNYAGAPWKTQKRIRQMLDTWFRNDLMGVPGDEDGGGMTSFVVFSSLGFYPVTPGSDIYAIGSPIFEKSAIRLENGNVFEIIASDVSDDNKYISSARLNGKPLDGPFITHSQLMSGGCLELEMSDLPDKEWGIHGN